jgi:hypothetical protein
MAKGRRTGETPAGARARAQALETARSILDSAAKGEQWDNETLEWAKTVLGNDNSLGVATG